MAIIVKIIMTIIVYAKKKKNLYFLDVSQTETRNLTASYSLEK